jgi:phosphatidate cytidylyltransferase
MMRHRVLNGAVMIGLLIGVLFLPLAGMFLIIPALAALMCWELYNLLDHAGLRNFRMLGTAAVLGLIGVTGGLYLCDAPLAVPEWEGLLLAGAVLAVMVRQLLERDDPRPLATMAATLFGVLYVGLIFNFYTKLLLRWPAGDGSLLLFYLILVVKVTDMSAYFTGSSLGRRKLCPRISPAKTWEGCIGGVAGGLVTSLLFWVVTGGDLGPVAFGIADMLILGMVLPVTGILGDLMESMLKRAAAVKDSGCWFKGMGGVLDILDSLLFAAPVLYIYIQLFKGL